MTWSAPSSCGHPGRDDVVGAEQLCDRLDDLRAGGRDDDDVATGLVVLGDQRESLRIHDRVDVLVQRLVDDLRDLGDVPARCERRQVGAHPLGLVGVGAADEVDELGVRRA